MNRLLRVLWPIPLLVACVGEAPDDKQYENPKAFNRSNEQIQNSIAQFTAKLNADVSNGAFGLLDEIYIQYNDVVLLHSVYDRDYNAIAGAVSPMLGMNDFTDPNWHPYHQQGTLHTTLSITKSITSLAIGVAEDEGLYPKVSDAKALENISPHYTRKLDDPLWAEVTIEDLLTMRMNLGWRENGDDPDWSRQWRTDDWTQYVLNIPMKGPPGRAYAYNSGASHLLSAVIQYATGASVEEYVQKKLFDPMGIVDVVWKTTPAGLSHTQGGLYIAAPDLAKICQLIENRGVWNGESLVSEDYLDRSFEKRTAFDEDSSYTPYGMGYGYQWWLGDSVFGANSINADGYGGQRLTCLPEKNLKIVVYGWNVTDLDQTGLTKSPEQAFQQIHQRIHDQLLPIVEGTP